MPNFCTESHSNFASKPCRPPKNSFGTKIRHCQLPKNMVCSSVRPSPQRFSPFFIFAQLLKTGRVVMRVSCSRLCPLAPTACYINGTAPWATSFVAADNNQEIAFVAAFDKPPCASPSDGCLASFSFSRLLPNAPMPTLVALFRRGCLSESFRLIQIMVAP